MNIVHIHRLLTYIRVSFYIIHIISNTYKTALIQIDLQSKFETIFLFTFFFFFCVCVHFIIDQRKIRFDLVTLSKNQVLFDQKNQLSLEKKTKQKSRVNLQDHWETTFGIIKMKFLFQQFNKNQSKFDPNTNAVGQWCKTRFTIKTQIKTLADIYILIYSPHEEPLLNRFSWLADWLPLYGWLIDIRKANAITRRHEPNRSPSAVRNGMAELSGSILNFHITWIIICAI